jgi:hypothetical protein
MSVRSFLIKNISQVVDILLTCVKQPYVNWAELGWWFLSFMCSIDIKFNSWPVGGWNSFCISNQKALSSFCQCPMSVANSWLATGTTPKDFLEFILTLHIDIFVFDASEMLRHFPCRTPCRKGKDQEIHWPLSLFVPLGTIFSIVWLVLGGL